LYGYLLVVVPWLLDKCWGSFLMTFVPWVDISNLLLRATTYHPTPPQQQSNLLPQAEHSRRL